MAKNSHPYVFWGGCFATVVLMLVPSGSFSDTFNFWDKAQHAIIFFLLMFTGCIAYSNQSIFLGLALIAYGTGVEVLQEYFTTSRNGDKMDIVADTVVCSNWLYLVLYRLQSLTQKEPDLT